MCDGVGFGGPTLSGFIKPLMKKRAFQSVRWSTAIGAALLLILPVFSYAYTDNTVVPTIQPLQISIDFTSADAATCLASNASDDRFEVLTYSPTNGYQYQDLLFTSLPGTLATSSSPGNGFFFAQVFCSDGVDNQDYGAGLNWNFNGGYANPSNGYNPYSVVDSGGGSGSTTDATTTSPTEVLATSWLFFSVFLTFVISIVLTIWTYRQLM